MREGDRQLGKPMRLYRDTKANLDLLALGVDDEGCAAYATDEDQFYLWDGTGWIGVAGTFLELSDTPISYAGQAGLGLVVNLGETELIFEDIATQAELNTHESDEDAHHAKVHTHADADEGGQLDWDDVWADAVHDHSIDSEGGVLQFINLDDTPISYLGEADKIVAVKADETGLEFIDPGVIGAHDLLSTTHPDTLPAAPVEGDLIHAELIDESPIWQRLPAPGAGGALRYFLQTKPDPDPPNPEWAAFNWAEASAAPGSDMIHSHADGPGGGQLSWDDVWADAVHDHSVDGEGGVLDHANLTGILADQHHAAFTAGDHSAIGDGAPHHAAVSLSADADVLLGLTGQQVTLDAQAANLIFAGPTSGGAAAPTFRSLVDADIPAAIARDAEVAADIAAHAAVQSGVHGLAITADKVLTLAESLSSQTGPGVLAWPAGGATLTVPGTGTAALGAGTLTVATANDVTGAAHTHAITSSSNPGAAAAILATDASGLLRLAGLGIGAAGAANTIVMADGAKIGQAAGPLIEFDDTNNYLGITGCSVGIGTVVPITQFQVEGSLGGIYLNRTGANEPFIILRVDGDISTGGRVKGISTGGLAFMDSTGATEWARINSSGNAGFGTAGPLGTVHIAGGNRTTLILDKTGSVITRFKMFVGDGTGGYTADENYIESLGTGLHFMAGAGGTTEIMTMLVGGNAGFGTPTPTISDGVGVHIAGKILRLATAKTPASAGATGNAGEICWDATYFYCCVAANSWRRVAHAAW